MVSRSSKIPDLKPPSPLKFTFQRPSFKFTGSKGCVAFNEFVTSKRGRKRGAACAPSDAAVKCSWSWERKEKLWIFFWTAGFLTKNSDFQGCKLWFWGHVFSREKNLGNANANLIQFKWSSFWSLDSNDFQPVAHIHLVNSIKCGGVETDRRGIPYTKEFCHYLHRFKEPTSRSKVFQWRKKERITSMSHLQREWCIIL